MNKNYFFSNTKSKLMLLACIIAGTISLGACSNDNEPEEPEFPEGVEYAAGEIPGLGDADGELTGTPFTFPDGIEIVGQITGAGKQSDYWSFAFSPGAFKLPDFVGKDGRIQTRDSAPETRAEEESDIHYFGSGYGYVDLLITLRNTRSTPITITFPPATIFRSVEDDCQHGVLIKKATVTIPANSDYLLALSFYCGNLERSSANRYDVFELGVVSNAQLLLEFCYRLRNKKINIEEFDQTNPEDRIIYYTQVDEIQNILWLITDGQGLTETDIEYINSLPNSR